jgi:cysteine desulfurase
MKKIYLDYAATTPVDKEVLKEMEPFFSKEYANAASLHKMGEIAKDAIENSRENILKKANGKDHKLIFTSGGTESNNFALKGLAFANKEKKHIITTKIEHDCVLNCSKFLEKNGYKLTYLPVDKEGFINLETLEKEITKDTLLVSIIHGNNEIGTIQDLKEISKIVHEKKSLLHTDACQSFIKAPIDLKKEEIDLMTINAHKIYGPKGVGGLLVKEGIKLEPLLHGGGHEFGIRSGTSNVPGIVGFGKSVDVIKEEDILHMEKLRDQLIKGLSNIEESWVNGPLGKKRLCNNVNVTFRYAEGESILLLLDYKGIEVSTGSACSSNTLEPSHVLRAIGLRQEDTHGSIRLSLGKETTKEDISYTIDSIKEVVEQLRKMSPLKK